MGAVRTRRTLDIKGADAVMAAAESEATRNGYRVVIAIVDAWGHLLQLRRTEDAQAASVQVAVDKARTAALYRRPSKDFEDQAAHGRPSALHLAQAVPLQGGVPVVHRGHVIAAVGMSGASSADEDNELAVLAADAAAAAARASDRDGLAGHASGPAAAS